MPRKQNWDKDTERYMRLLMAGKDPLFEDGKERALQSIREGATEPDYWIVAHPIMPSYIAGYISVFRSMGMLGTAAK